MDVTVALFDIDGTLLRAGGAGRRAVERALGDVLGGRDDVTLESIEFAGRTDPWIIAAAFEKYGVRPDEGLIAQVLDRYLERLPGELRAATAFEVLPGVSPLLERLFERDDVILGLGTGNAERAAYAKLARGGLDSFFSFGGFGSDHTDRAEVLRVGLARAHATSGSQPTRVVVIGDTPHDVHAALAIGADCVAVTTGRYDHAALRAAGAPVVVPDLRAPAVLEAFF